MGGYKASGITNNAIPPASVITMDRTEAKIGRSMKNREIKAGPPARLRRGGTGAAGGQLRSGQWGGGTVLIQGVGSVGATGGWPASVPRPSKTLADQPP